MSNTITLTLTEDEATAVGFALTCKVLDVEIIIQNAFVQPLLEDETADGRLESLLNLRQLRDRMNAVLRQAETQRCAISHV